MELKDRAKRLGLPEDSNEEAVVVKEKELGMVGKDGKPLTQEAFDDVWKAKKTVEEKLSTAEREKVDAITRAKKAEEEIARLRKPKTTFTRGALSEVYNNENYPETEEEWDDLFDENPRYATDLRQSFNDRRKSSETEIQVTAKKIQDDHKDMFLVDENGNFILDTNGRVQVDPKTPKGKAFLDAVGDDPRILQVKGGLEKVMELALARLDKKKGAESLEKLNKEKEEAEKKRQESVKAGGVASGGKTPPPPKKVDVKFNSKEEEEYVERQVAKGIYKDKEHYCRVRDNKEVPYGRGGF